jgi:hypothetical protein
VAEHRDEEFGELRHSEDELGELELEWLGLEWLFCLDKSLVLPLALPRDG